MRFNFTLFLITLSFIFCGAVYSQQTDPLKDILNKLEKFRTDFPQEKVHLHLDKPYYTVGDSIWFKAYVVDAEKNQPSGLSKILYVELINEKDSVKQTLRLPLTSGLCWGDFTLADTLKEGNYRIRAYTNWMRNFGDEYFYDKTIRIGNSLSNNILTDATYTFSKAGNSEKVLASITYSDLEGKPIAGKEVTYNVQLDFRNIANGKGITDQNGNLKINFVNAQPFILKSGKINTSIKMEDKVSVTKVIPVKATSDAASVQFFPESGQLVNSIRSRVAFKAVRADGLGIDISGYVTDKDNNKLAEFKTEHAGMGSFILVPLNGNSYKAVVKFSDGSEKSYDLPKARQTGYVLAADNSNSDNIEIKISVSQDILSRGGDITLIAQTNNVMQYVAKTKLSTSILNTVLPKKRFPTGILQLTVFSSDNQPVAERLVFIEHNDQLKISASTDKQSYANREKVRMTINVTDETGKPVVGNFSMAVTDQGIIASDEETSSSIFSDLLLSSDLNGFIESPNYYFTASTGSKLQELDNLMLTQGWRRFIWKNILNNAYPNISTEAEQSISISGRVVSNTQNPVANARVSLLASSGNGLVLDTLTDKAGNFKFDNLFFNSATKFVLQARNDKGRSNVNIELNYIRPPVVTPNRNASDIEVNVNNSILSYLKSRKEQFDEMRLAGLMKKSILLSEVKVTEKKPVVANSTNLNGAGNADAVIKSDQLQNCNSLEQCLQGKVAGLYFQNGLPYLTRNMGRGPMQVIVDGINYQPQFVSGIVPSDIESIEILKSGGTTAIYGLSGGNGVMLINTKRAQPQYARYNPGIATYDQLGFYLGRQFYSPDYDNPNTNTKLADHRATIYWNPTVVTNAEGKATVEYFNSDGKGQYKTLIEGLNIDGKLGHYIYNYTVK